MAESISAKTAWALAKAIKGGSKKKLPNSGNATVVRIDQDGTHWVRISGSDVETPVNGAITADARPGDVVQYHLEDTRISITGNATSPSVGKEYVDERIEPVEAKVDVVARANALLSTATERARSVADAAKSVADAVNQHFFSDTNGVHVTEATQEEWDENHSGANVLINSIGQLFRDGLNNLLTLTTEGNARALTIWDGLGNTASNVRAMFGEVITLGGTSESHVVVSQDAITMLDAKGNVFMDVRDNGLYQTRTYTLTASGYNGTDFPSPQPMLIKDSETDVTITVDGVPYEYGVDVTFDKNINGDVVKLLDVWFIDTAPAAGSTIVVTFRTESDKTYTLGKRTDGTTEGPYSFVEGYNNEASGYMSHAEGGECSSTDLYTHAEGNGCVASHPYAHAEGWGTTSSGNAAHSEGLRTVASGAMSHAQNAQTIAASNYQTALGRYNVADANNTYAVIVGNGTSDSNRSNALTVDWDGNVTHGVDVPWTNLQLASSVVAYSSGQTPKYRKWGPVVQVIGAVKLKSNQSAGFNVDIGTLPSGCRPLVQVATVCQGSGNDTWLCNVSAGGVMNIERYRNGGTNAAATTSTWLPFSITFLTA